MDQLIFASLSHTHYWYEVGMLKVESTGYIGTRRIFSIFLDSGTGFWEFNYADEACEARDY